MVKATPRPKMMIQTPALAIVLSRPESAELKAAFEKVLGREITAYPEKGTLKIVGGGGHVDARERSIGKLLAEMSAAVTLPADQAAAIFKKYNF